MTKITAATMSAEDWENLRKQLRVLVDIYCEMNDEILRIKTALRSLVKELRKKSKKKSQAKRKR